MQTANKPPKLDISLTPVTSSMLKGHGYDAESKTLAIQFSSGQVYHYANVSQAVAAALADAKSIGSFFGTHIRGKFTGVAQ
jgi:hypothetical protein